MKQIRVQKLLAMIPTTLNWKLMDRDPLETWIHKGGKLVLLGDSCHPMLVCFIGFVKCQLTPFYC
jgi:hypothetical protein